MKVAKSILDLRQRLGMNQAQFAKAIDVSQGSVSKWESGREKPRIDALERIKDLSRQIETELELETTAINRPEKMLSVPLVGSVAGVFERADWGPEDIEYLVLPFPAHWEKAALEARVVERSRSPEFPNGTIVVSTALQGGDELAYIIQGLTNEEHVIVKTVRRNEGTSFSIWEFVVDRRKKQGAIWPIEKEHREWPQTVDENGITQDGQSRIVGIIVATFRRNRSRVDFTPLPDL